MAGAPQRSPPVLQGVWGRSPPELQGIQGGAASWNCGGLRNCEGYGGRSPPVKQGGLGGRQAPQLSQFVFLFFVIFKNVFDIFL